MKRTVAFLFVLLLLLTVGCGDKKPSRVVEGSMEFTAETLPRICVTEQTVEAAVNAVCAVLGVESDVALQSLVVCENTDECYTKLMNNECDIVLAHIYGIKVANELQDMPLPVVENELKTDALIFITNGLLGVEGLTSEQIRSLYKSEIVDWKDLGYEECPVTLFGCAEGTAARGTFERYFGSDMPEITVNKTVQTENGEFSTEIGFDNRNGAIGYTLQSLVDKSATVSVKPMAVDGVIPSEETLASGKYPYRISVLAVMRGDEDQNSNASVLYRWLLSEQGRTVMGF